jgi:YfiH family protein
MFYAKTAIGDYPVAVAGRNPTAADFLTNPFAGLNLSDYVGDNPEIVAKNQAELAASVSSQQWVTVRAQHSNQVHVVTKPGAAPLGDALVTTTPGIALMALAADCVPIALADPNAGVIAVVHSGWKGLVAQVVSATVVKMQNQGANLSNISAVLGPSICGACYEVDNSRAALVRERISAAVPDANHIDVAAGVTTQLEAFGISWVKIPGCTQEDERLFSYRRAAGSLTGRGGIAIAIPQLAR